MWNQKRRLGWLACGEKRKRKEQSTSKCHTGLALMRSLGANSLLVQHRGKNTNHFSLKQGQTNSTASQNEWALHSQRKLMVVLPSAWLTKETQSRSHQSRGWYTTDGQASWKRPLAIRNSSSAPVVQMTPSNFPFPFSELLPRNLPCPLLWLGRWNESFTERAGFSSPPSSFFCTHKWWLIQEHCGEPDAGPPPFSSSGPLCGMRAHEVKVEDQTFSSKVWTCDSLVSPWKPPFAV